MNGIEKYIREVYGVATTVAHLIEAAQMDLVLQKDDREDVVWELSRLKSALADTVAALVAIGAKDDGV